MYLRIYINAHICINLQVIYAHIYKYVHIEYICIKKSATTHFLRERL